MSDAFVWSHFELVYFHDLVLADVIQELVTRPQPAGTDLLRTEILLTTPSSSIVPRDWQGWAARLNYQASLEFLQVKPSCLGQYRDVMREYCGPAAAKLVRAARFEKPTAMETAAMLYHDPRLIIDWNQVHLCELDPDGFEGFGTEFEAALRKDLPEGASFLDSFDGLARLRTEPRLEFRRPIGLSDAAMRGSSRAA